MSSTKSTLLLKNIDCASCADKIDIEINKIDGVKKSNVNFVSSKLTVEIEQSEDREIVLDKIKNKIKIIEPNINVTKIDDDNEKDEEEKERKREIGLLIMGGIIFFVGVFTNLVPPWEFIVFFISYILLGADVVIKAVKNIFRGNVFDENFLMALATIGAFAIGQYPEGVAVMLFYKVGESFQSYAVNNLEDQFQH